LARLALVCVLLAPASVAPAAAQSKPETVQTSPDGLGYRFARAGWT